MDIRVSGHQVDVGEALRGRVEERLSAIAEKYFARVISAQVTFGKGPHDHGFTSEIVAYVPNGVVLKGTDRAADATAAFDSSASVRPQSPPNCQVPKQMRETSRSVGPARCSAPARPGTSRPSATTSTARWSPRPWAR